MRTYEEQSHAIEAVADELMEKFTFEHTLSAVNLYMLASNLWKQHIETDVALSSNVNCKMQQYSIEQKIIKANEQLASPKLKMHEA